MAASTVKYLHGYSNATISTYACRTAESDTSFLIPHVKPTDNILDVGCGPGSITVDLAALIPAGSVLGVDLSNDVLDQARKLASEINMTNVTFEEGDLFAGLPYRDNTFDIIYTSQVFPHLASRSSKLKALAELRCVLKPGGIFGSRDTAELHLYPHIYGLDRLWAGNIAKALRDKSVDNDGYFLGGDIPSLLRESGFEAANITVSASTAVYHGAESRN